jgi:hypothetical protein
MTERKENPMIVAINKRNRKISATIERLAEKRATEAPSALLAAIQQTQWMRSEGVPPKFIPSIESLLVGDRLKQSLRGQKARSKEPDALDQLILEGIQKEMSTKAMWPWVLKRAQETDGLNTDTDDAIVEVWDDKKMIRSVKKSSFEVIVSTMRKKFVRPGDKS